MAGGIKVVPADGCSSGEDVVVLDPSVVFGDGSHPTTIACLRAMGRVFRTQRIYSFLDLGTGSGILALAAGRIGIRHVLAVDLNRLAVSTAKENVEANSLSDVVRVEHGEARLFLDKPFDVVAANLPFHVLRDLAAGNSVHLHRFWIVSGINEPQAELLKELFMEQGYEWFYESIDSPWVTFAIYNRRRRH